MKVCLWGAGPGALAMACRLRQAGHGVVLGELDRFKSNIDSLAQRRAVEASGMIAGRFDLDLVTSRAAEALARADLVMVVTHAAAHQEIAELCARHIDEPRPVILCPGYVGGGWRFLRRLEALRPQGSWPVLECSVLPFACRKTAQGGVSVHGIKRRFFLSAPAGGDIGPAARLMAELFAGAELREHPLEAGLHESNFIIHACLALLNLGRVQGGEPWTFYRQGLSEGMGRLIEALDAERCDLLEGMGLPPIPLTKWLRDFYGDQGMQGESIYQMLSTFAPFASSPGPLSLTHRYFSEDLPYGLGPMACLSSALGLEAPLSESLLSLAGAVCRRDFKAPGQELGAYAIQSLDRL